MEKLFVVYILCGASQLEKSMTCGVELVSTTLDDSR